MKTTIMPQSTSEDSEESSIMPQGTPADNEESSIVPQSTPAVSEDYYNATKYTSRQRRLL